MTIQATDLDSLKDTIKAKILSISPRHQREGVTGWSFHDRAAPTARTRRFRIDATRINRTPGGWMGAGVVDTQILLEVVTDYEIEESEIDEILDDDHDDLLEALLDLRSPFTSPSAVLAVDSEGPQGDGPTDDNPRQQQVRHTFRLRFMKERNP